jgi:GTPase
MQIQIAPAEIEEGNIEYKRHFINITNTRLNQLTAQMNWRINEGNGICYYYLGVCDDGYLYDKFTQEEIDYSLDIIKMMADGCNSYIENIKLNRVYDNIWLNISIKRKNEYMNEYRIYIKNNNLKKLMKREGYEYKTLRDIYFNTIIHNNEKYLFFECKKNIDNIDKINNIINFNLIINDNFNTISELLSYVEKNMIGNNNNDTDEVIFNIIKFNYIQSIGYIISGFLKSGKIKKGMMLISNKYNLSCQIISIHNNYIDCNDVMAPATISINVLIIDKSIYGEINKLDGSLNALRSKIHHDQSELEFPLDLQQQRLDRRSSQLRRRAQRKVQHQKLSHGQMEQLHH